MPLPNGKSYTTRLGPNIKTVLGDVIHWDTRRLPLHGCADRDPTQLWRCRKHKRIEADCLRRLPLRASVVDCGAHFGDTVLTLAVHAVAIGRTDLRFWAVEPSRRKCQFIQSMVRSNNALQNMVTIVNACVGDKCRVVQPVAEESRRFGRYDGRVAYQEKMLIGDEEACIGNVSDCIYFRAGDQDDTEEGSNSEADDSSEEDGDEDSPIRMISIDSLQDEIMPLGLLHLDVEGWEARVLQGARSVLEATKTKSFVIAEVWSERDCKRRKEAVLDEGKPDEGVLHAMKEHVHFQRVDDIVDQERNLMFECDAVVDCDEGNG